MVKLFRHKNEVSKKEDSEEQIIKDANIVLDIIKNSVSVTSVSYQNVYYVFGKRLGLPYDSVNGLYRSYDLEQRVSDGLRLLVARGYLGWGGNRDNSISFSKSNLPSCI